jgi:DNA polymerase III epsilon subunit-like protein
MSESFVVIDTETSGLFDYSKPADAEGQPRMASVAFVHLGDDLTEAFAEVAHEFLIRPDGWRMSDEVAMIHGLTHERLMADGVPVIEALDYYNGILDGNPVIVGYNASFDLKVLRAELRRAGKPDRFEGTRSIDCMRPLTDICKVPKAGGKAGFKGRKGTEAYKAICQRDLVGAHGALADARACAEIFREMHPRGIFKIAGEARIEAI